jgi:large subunit ribosomal protein L7/L12
MVETTERINEIVGSIEGMTVLELSNLVKVLEEKFGVTAAAPMLGVMPAGGAAAGAGAQEDVKDKTFDVILTGAGDKKIQVLKVVREITGLGLKEAKEVVDATPKPVKLGVKKEEADELKKKLEEQGATVELK